MEQCESSRNTFKTADEVRSEMNDLCLRISTSPNFDKIVEEFGLREYGSMFTVRHEDVQGGRNAIRRSCELRINVESDAQKVNS